MLYAAVHLKCPCMDLHTMVVGYFDMVDVECRVYYQVTFVCGLCPLFASWARSAILASQAMFALPLINCLNTSDNLNYKREGVSHTHYRGVI